MSHRYQWSALKSWRDAECWPLTPLGRVCCLCRRVDWTNFEPVGRARKTLEEDFSPSVQTASVQKKSLLWSFPCALSWGARAPNFVTVGAHRCQMVIIFQVGSEGANTNKQKKQNFPAWKQKWEVDKHPERRPWSDGTLFGGPWVLVVIWWLFVLKLWSCDGDNIIENLHSWFCNEKTPMFEGRKEGMNE